MKMGILISDKAIKYTNKYFISILTGSQEVRDIPCEEHFESMNEDEQDIPENTPVSNIWLEAVVIDILFQIKSLGKHSPSYASVTSRAMGNLEMDLRQHMYVKLIVNHEKYPPAVPRFTSQLRVPQIMDY
jgi:hypothetical protein